MHQIVLKIEIRASYNSENTIHEDHRKLDFLEIGELENVVNPILKLAKITSKL